MLRRSGVCKASACVCDIWWDGAQCEHLGLFAELLLVLSILLCGIFFVIMSLSAYGKNTRTPGVPDCLVSAYVNWRIAHELRAEQMQDLPDSSEIHEVKSVPVSPVKSCMICSYDWPDDAEHFPPATSTTCGDKHDSQDVCKHCLARDIEQKVMAVANQVVAAVAMNDEEGQYGVSCVAVDRDGDI